MFPGSLYCRGNRHNHLLTREFMPNLDLLTILLKTDSNNPTYCVIVQKGEYGGLHGNFPRYLLLGDHIGG